MLLLAPDEVELRELRKHQEREAEQEEAKIALRNLKREQAASRRQRARELLAVETEREDVGHRLGTFVTNDGYMHHTDTRPDSFVAVPIEDLRMPKIEDDRLRSLEHVFDNILDHHTAEEKVEPEEPKDEGPKYDDLGHRIHKHKKKRFGPTYHRPKDAKALFAQMRQILPEAHTEIVDTT